MLPTYTRPVPPRAGTHVPAEEHRRPAGEKDPRGTGVPGSRGRQRQAQAALQHRRSQCAKRSARRGAPKPQNAHRRG